jgi:hypothetical protein
VTLPETFRERSVKMPAAPRRRQLNLLRARRYPGIRGRLTQDRESEFAPGPDPTARMCRPEAHPTGTVVKVGGTTDMRVLTSPGLGRSTYHDDARPR